MNCVSHPEVVAHATCNACADPLCASCAIDVRGVPFCNVCLDERLALGMPDRPAEAQVPPAPEAAPERLKRPKLAAFLSVFPPGLGQVYNGLVARGLGQFAVWFFLIWLVDQDTAVGPLVGVVLFAFWIWVAFDAHATAKDINRTGRLPSPEEARALGRIPLPGLDEDGRVLGIALLCVGGLVLLAELGVAHFVGKLVVPVGLIGVGLWMLRRGQRERQAARGADAGSTDDLGG